MARKRYGIQISQEGIPVKRAADYQKVLDDRWPYLDIFKEVEIRFEYKYVDSTESYDVVIDLMSHGLGYLPAFTYRMVEGDLGDFTEVVATKTNVYLSGFYIPGQAETTLNGKILLRVFACDMTADFEYGVGQIEPTAKRDSRKYGAKVLKPGVPPEKFKGTEMSDFSLHNDAKVLAIQKTGVFHLNPWAELDPARVTAITTGTDILTLGIAFAGDDISWTTVLGQAVNYSPNDFATFPAPLAGNTYYLIPQGSGAVKLANSYSNALNNIPIDITSAGSLPGQLSAAENSAVPTDRLYHGAGYPPAYWMARVEYWESLRQYSGTTRLVGEDIIYPSGRGFDQGYTYATTEYLRFRGAQAVAGGRHAYIIFKDPLERAV